MIGENKRQKRQKQKKMEFAEELLIQLFRRHLLLEAQKVYALGQTLGLSERTLRQARKNLRLDTVKIMGQYYWQPTFWTFQLLLQKSAGKIVCQQKDKTIIGKSLSSDFTPALKSLMDRALLELVLELPPVFKTIWILKQVKQTHK